MAKDAKGHGSEKRGASAVDAPAYEGKPTWHGVTGSGQRVTNSAGNPIAYASREAAVSGAKHVESLAAQHGVSTGQLAPGGRFGYNPQAVNNAIASSNRHGRKIGGREARMIHALLKGRG